MRKIRTSLVTTIWIVFVMFCMQACAAGVANQQKSTKYSPAPVTTEPGKSQRKLGNELGLPLLTVSREQGERPEWSAFGMKSPDRVMVMYLDGPDAQRLLAAALAAEGIEAEMNKVGCQVGERIESDILESFHGSISDSRMRLLVACEAGTAQAEMIMTDQYAVNLVRLRFSAQSLVRLAKELTQIMYPPELASR